MSVVLDCRTLALDECAELNALISLSFSKALGGSPSAASNFQSKSYIKLFITVPLTLWLAFVGVPGLARFLTRRQRYRLPAPANWIDVGPTVRKFRLRSVAWGFAVGARRTVYLVLAAQLLTAHVTVNFIAVTLSLVVILLLTSYTVSSTTRCSGVAFRFGLRCLLPVRQPLRPD